MERFTIGALVTIDVHARDVVTLLKELGIDSETDFDWLSQLRYTLEDGNVWPNATNLARFFSCLKHHIQENPINNMTL